MAKKRKNSNYVTEKTIAKKQMQEKAVRKKKLTKKIALISIISVIVIAIAASIVIMAFNDVFFSPTVTHHASIEIEGYDEAIHLELYGEMAPQTVENFVTLAEDGFYDGLTLHRIIENFMMQGGAPKDNDTPDTIKGEFSANGFENPLKHRRGVISMARSGDTTSGFDTASSQFFIVHEDSFHLDGQYAAFGRVTSGMAVVDDICENTPVTDSNGTVAASDQPVIKSITIHAAH